MPTPFCLGVPPNVSIRSMTMNNESQGVSVAGSPREAAPQPPPELPEWAQELVERARADEVELTGEGGLLTAMVRAVLQTGLEVEMTDHLGYEHGDLAGRGSGNSRNGTYPRPVAAEIGDVTLEVPRDQAGTFEPVGVPKYQRRLDGLAGNVISLCAKGLTTGDIQSTCLRSTAPRRRGRQSR